MQMLRGGTYSVMLEIEMSTKKERNNDGTYCDTAD
jgi:hypothetical protein